jgi:hypothetical protein
VRQSAPKMKNTLPRIVTTKDLKLRSYITFYYLGKRIREYNGDSINIDLKPNTASTIKERNDLLKRLEYEYIKALENNYYPTTTNSGIDITSVEESFISVNEYLEQALSKKPRFPICIYSSIIPLSVVFCYIKQRCIVLRTLLR